MYKTVKDAVGANALGNSLFANTFKFAQDNIKKDEEILFAFTGNLKFFDTQKELKQDLLKTKGKIACVIVVSDKRLLFAHVNGFATKILKYIDIKDLQSVEVHRTMFGASKVRITSFAFSVSIDGHEKWLNPFNDALEKAKNKLELPRETSTN